MTSRTLMAALATLLIIGTVSSAEAKHYRHHVAHRGGGACDGFQRCRCGTTAARINGLSYDHNGMNLKKASSWYAFPHTSFGVGAVAVYPHHVATITGGSSCSSATVHDDAGVYQRNVCGATFVVPGGSVTQTSDYSAQRRGHRHSRHNDRVQYAEIVIFNREMPH